MGGAVAAAVGAGVKGALIVHDRSYSSLSAVPRAWAESFLQAPNPFHLLLPLLHWVLPRAVLSLEWSADVTKHWKKIHDRTLVTFHRDDEVIMCVTVSRLGLSPMLPA